jgi:hypothetical protein
METFHKFEGIDYVNNFAKRINSVHQLVIDNLEGFIKQNMFIIDLGGGPGIGAKIIDGFGKKVQVLNIEPSNNVNTIPELQWVEYNTLSMSFTEAQQHRFSQKADLILMISSAHEMALSYGKSSNENKHLFFRDLTKFLSKNLIAGGYLCIGFPNYINGVGIEEVQEQRSFTDSLLGHSHPPDEFFSVQEFSNGLGFIIEIHESKPMILASESVDQTKLVANFVVFKNM